MTTARRRTRSPVYGIDKDKNDNYFKVFENRDNSDDSKALTDSGEDFYIADVKEDDAYLVTVAEGAIQTLAAAEVVGDVTLTAFKKNSDVVADGTTYNYAHAAEYDFEVLDEYTGSNGSNLKELTAGPVKTTWCAYAKGEVVLVTLAKTALSGNEYVDDIKNVEVAVNDKDTVLYEASTYEGVTPSIKSKALTNQPEGPSLKGSTLFVAKSDKQGFHVDENVNIVFRQMNDNKWTTEYDEGVSKLQSYIEDLNADTKGKHSYEVSAIPEGGSAKVAVIRDLTPDGDSGTAPEKPSAGSVMCMLI